MYQTAPTGEEERDGSGYQTLDTGPPGERQTFADQKAPPPTDATPAALSEGIKSGLFGMFKGPIDRALVIPKLFYFFFFSAFGSLFPLIAIYFKQNGMNATQAGVIIGIRPFVEYFSAPVWAKVAVRLKKGKILMLVSVVAWIVFTDPIAVVQTAPKYCLRLDDTTNATTYILENARGRLGSNDLPEAKATERGPKDDLENIKAGIAPIVITKADVPNYNQKQYGVLVRPPNSYKVFKQNAVEESFMLILLLVILGEFFSAPAINMADACTLHALGDTGSINYGRQRMLGSIGWGFAMFIVGIALDFSETFPDYPCSMRSSMEKNYKICFIFFSIFMLAALGVATRFVFPEENLEACSNQDDSGPEIQPPATEAKYQIMDSQAVQVDPAIAEKVRSRAPEPKEQKKGHWLLSTLKTFSSLHYVSFFIVPFWKGFGTSFVFAFQAVQLDPAIAEKARSRAPEPKEQEGHWLLSTLKTFSSLHYVSLFIVALWNGFGTGFVFAFQAVQVDPAIAEKARSRAPEPKEQKGHWLLSTLKTFSSLHYVSFFIVPFWKGFGTSFVFAFQAVQLDPAIAQKARSRAPEPKEQKGHWLLSTLKTFSSLHYVSFFIVPLWNGFGTSFVYAFQAVQLDPAIAEKARSRAPEPKEQKGHWLLSTLKTFSSLHYVSFFIVPLWNGFGTSLVFAFQAVQLDPAIAEKARSRAPEPKEQKGHWLLSTLKTFSSLHYVSFFIVPFWKGFGTTFVFAFQAVQLDPAIAQKARSRAPEPKEQKGHWLLSTLKTFSSLHYVSFFIVPLWNGFGTSFVFAFQAVQLDPAIAEKARSRAPEPKEQKGHWLLSTLKTFSSLHYVSFFIVPFWKGFGTSFAVQVDPAIAEMARSRAPEPKEQKGHWPLSTLKTFSSLHYVSFFIVPLWNGFGSGFVFAFQAVQVDPAIAEKARSRAPGPKEQKGHWLLSTLKTFSSLHYVSFFIVPLWNGFGTGFVFAFQAVQVDPAIAEKARSRAPETKEQKGHWPLSTLKTFSSLHYVSFFIVPLWNGFGTGFVFAFQAVQVDPAIAEKARSRAPEPKEQKGHWPLSTLKTFSSLHYVSFFIVPLWNGFGTGFVFAFQAVQVDPAIAEKARSRAPEPKEQKGHWLLSTLKTFSSLHYVSFFIVALWNGFGTGYVFAFLFWHLQDLGGTPFLFGLASVTNHVAEIIAHFVAFQIINRFGHIKVLYFGLMCSVLRFLYISILTSPFWVLPFELVQGVSHAVVWASATSYISLVSPAAYKNNAQSLLQGTQHGLGRGFGAIIGGIITTYQGTAFMFRLYGTLSLLVLIAYMGINRLFKIDAVKYQADGFDDAGALAPHGIPMNVPYSASNEQLDVSNGGNQAYGAADPTQDAYDKYITQDQYAKPVRFEALPDDLR